MLLGYEHESELIRTWEAKYGVPIFTAGSSQVAALRALGVKRIVGVSYFRGEMNASFAQYFTDAGFEVLSMTGLDVDFTKVQELSSLQVYKFAKASYMKHPEADAIYMLGTAWPSLDILEMLEHDAGVPVLHSVAAKSWEIQHRLRIRGPITGYGRLLAELPPPVSPSK
jgi:maleate isomerase